MALLIDLLAACGGRSEVSWRADTWYPNGTASKPNTAVEGNPNAGSYQPVRPLEFSHEMFHSLRSCAPLCKVSLLASSDYSLLQRKAVLITVQSILESSGAPEF